MVDKLSFNAHYLRSFYEYPTKRKFKTLAIERMRLITKRPAVRK